MSQYVVLEMVGMHQPLCFHCNKLVAHELFEKVRKCHEERVGMFFIEVDMEDGAIYRVAVIPQNVRTMATYPTEPPNKDLIAELRRQNDMLKKSLDHGDEWKGDDDAE